MMILLTLPLVYCVTRVSNTRKIWQQTERSTVGWAALLAGCERRHCCDDQVIGRCTVARMENQQAVSAERYACA